MKKISFIVLIFSCIILPTCRQSTDNKNDVYTGLKAFETWEVKISADTNHVVINYPIVISTRCKPLLTGKGRIAIHGGGALNLSSWIIDSPVIDTLVRPKDDTTFVSYRVNFISNQSFEQKWTIRCLNPTEYGFSSEAVFDSIFISDSSRYYHIGSIEARTKYGLIDGGPAGSYPPLQIPYP